ncbi:FAD-dependent monooxygenase [Haloferula sp. BvORR071]|uniref:FAD-dependent monooxygenase n=1 Tax=Haloferula sp. BvORR071 TaxID=1396141 RepID=UPI0005594B4E|nr:FAD-dependent monooxygenase [Haloferula sp. BvORR071]
MSEAAEVIIVGAGIAGLAMAIALRQRGLNPVVLEQAPELREIGAGLLLAPNACAVLERLGALDFLKQGHSVEVPRWELRNWRGKLLSTLSIPRAGQDALSTRRSDLQKALLGCLPADCVQLASQVSSARLSAGGVSLSLADGRELRGKRVIVADGSHSQARASLWPESEPLYCGYVGWRGIVDHVPAGWERGRVSESWGQGRRFGIAPVGGGKTYWYATATVPEARSRERVGIAELRRDFAGWHAPIDEVLETTPNDKLLQHPISDRRPERDWQRDEKLVLIGDAAHPLTPNLGQGASMALEDAWELANLWGRTDAMLSYVKRRRWRVMRLWAMSRSLGKLIQWHNPLACGIRDLQMQMTPDGLSTAMMRSVLRYDPATAGLP